MPGFDPEDKNASLGDPSVQTTTPLSQKQMQGAQQATVNRTQLPTNAQKGGAAQPEKPDSQNGKAPDGKQGQQPDAGSQPPSILGQPVTGAGLTGDAYKQEADQALGLNPAHAQDWWRHALESPAESYFLGKHIYNAYMNAFLDPGAIQASVHDIWGQDNAVSWLLQHQEEIIGTLPGGATLNAVQGARRALAGQTPEQQTEGDVGTGLTTAANPENLLYVGGPTARGAAMVAQWIAPGAINAIFGNQHSASDLAWAVVPAMLFGGKLPGPLEAQVAKVAPGFARLADKMIAAKMAQDANKVAAQDRNRSLEDLMEYGAMPPKSTVLAKFWTPDVKPLTADEQKGLNRSLLKRYGTLDREKLIDRMLRSGASPRLLNLVWQRLMKMDYELTLRAEGELPIQNPSDYSILAASDGNAVLQKKIEEGHQFTWQMINQARLGISGHAADPIVSHVRSILGMQTTNKLVEQLWSKHLIDAAGPHASDPKTWDLLSRSLESDKEEAQAAFEKLPTELKYVRASMRAVAAGLGMAGEELGLFDRVSHYWPRVGITVKDGKGMFTRPRQLLTTEPRVHRTLAVFTRDLLTEQQMEVRQAYATVKDANAAVARQRGYVAEAIVNGTPWHEIAAETGAGIPHSDIELIEGIAARAATDPEGALQEAKAYAEDLVPLFSENPFDSLHKLGNQLRAVTSARALNKLTQVLGKDDKAVAVPRPPNSRAYQQEIENGYRPLSLPGRQYSQVLVQRDFADLIEQMAKPEVQSNIKKLAELEHKVVVGIMYSPRIHGMNMALRLGMAFGMHPQEVSRWFAEGLMQAPNVTRITADELHMRPWRAGMVPPNPDVGAFNSGMAEEYLHKDAELFGDSDIGRTPLARDLSQASDLAKASKVARSVLGNARDLLWGRQSDLWSWISDFGNMMWWIEFAAAQRGGIAGGRLSEQEAERYATARANSWMGHVSPHDWNPNLHAALKTAFFAPNWWRTWGELLTGYYRNQGIGSSEAIRRYMVENEIKTALAAVLFQQLSANVLNMVFSGHTIYQNDPGNWGKVEITAPWAIEMLNNTVLKGSKIDPKTGRDAKGAKLTWENPLARQMTDVEGMMGLLTSAPNWSPQTFAEGFSSFGAARTSPLMQSIWALANLDLYRTISSDGFRYVDPNKDTIGGAPLTDLITAGGDLTPFSYIPQQIQQQVMQGNVDELKGPFGLQIPKAVLAAFDPKNLGQDALRSFFVGLTGTNIGYMRSAKTQGVSPSDDAYKQVHELQTKYQQRMSALSTATLSGQMAPYQWIAVYRQLSATHATQMQTLFGHAPEYENGPLALTNSYEALYDQATDKNGVLQPDRLRSLQSQWRANHSQADYVGVQNELRANDSKYPMLALYHKSMDAYYNWQSEWAKENGVDIETLRADLSGWSAVYNDRNASQQWLADHPELGQFEAAKKSDFESGQSQYGMAGLMYALFFNPTAADNFLLTTGDTARQVEQAAQQEQVPTAP